MPVHITPLKCPYCKIPMRLTCWKRDSITIEMLLGNEYQIKGE